MMSAERVARLKADYPARTRIRLIHMDDPYAPVPGGTMGTVAAVDDAGNIHMKWDNGRSLAICPDVDSFAKAGDE